MKRSDFYGIFIIALLLALLFITGYHDRINELKADCYYNQSQPECSELKELEA